MSSLGKHKLTDEDPAIATTRKEPFYVDDSSTISLEHYLIPKHYEGTLDSLLIPYGTIISRIEKVAHDIIKDYEGKTIHLLCVLKGGETFFHDLCNALRRYYSHRDHGPIIPFVFDFIRVSSYNGTESTGEFLFHLCLLLS
jgi:hypoxanthine phosphoribosyltransferase